MKGSLFHNMWRFDRTLSPDRGRHALHSSLLNFCTDLHALPLFLISLSAFTLFPVADSVIKTHFPVSAI